MNTVYIIEFYDDLLLETELHGVAFNKYYKAVDFLGKQGYQFEEHYNDVVIYKLGKHEKACIRKLEVK